MLDGLNGEMLTPHRMQNVRKTKWMPFQPWSVPLFRMRNTLILLVHFPQMSIESWLPLKLGPAIATLVGHSASVCREVSLHVIPVLESLAAVLTLIGEDTTMDGVFVSLERFGIREPFATKPTCEPRDRFHL